MADSITSSAQLEKAKQLVDELNGAGADLLKSQMPKEVATKWADWRQRMKAGLSSDYLPELSAFTDEQLNAYNTLKGNGNSEENMLKLAPFLAEVTADKDLQLALNWGGNVSNGVGGARPNGNAAAARAYDKALKEMIPILGKEKAAIVAYETSLLTHVAGKIDEIDRWIQANPGIAMIAGRGIVQDRNVYAAALVDRDVYFDKSIQEILPSNMMRLEQLDNNRTSGLFLATYGDKLTGKTFVSARGTEMLPGRKTLDWAANILQGEGWGSAQYSEAMKFAREKGRLIGANKLIFTGHSLGGGLASAMASVVPGSQGITFNASGLSESTLKPYGRTLASNKNIQAYYVQGELLSGGQDYVAPALVRGGGLNAKLLLSLPQAAGQRIPLAPVTDPIWDVQMNGDGEVDTYQAGTPMLPMPWDALHLHGMPQVINALGPRIDSTIQFMNNLSVSRWTPQLNPAPRWIPQPTPLPQAARCY